MGDGCRKPVWPWIAAVLIGLPVLYVVSFGPACWITSRLDRGSKLVPVAYRPILRITYPDPWVLRNNIAQVVVMSYSTLFAAPGWGWTYSDETGHMWGAVLFP